MAQGTDIFLFEGEESLPNKVLISRPHINVQFEVDHTVALRFLHNPCCPLSARIWQHNAPILCDIKKFLETQRCMSPTNDGSGTLVER